MNLFRSIYPLKSPLRLGDKVITKREGIVGRKDDLAVEYSPLEYLGQEAIGEILNSEGKLLWLKTYLEQYHDYFSHNYFQGEVKNNELISAKDSDTMLNELWNKVHAGKRNFKIKLGHFDLENVISFLAQINHLEYNDLKLRLDFNENLSVKAFEEFSVKVDQRLIEYVESPCAESIEKSPLTLALDLRPKHLNDLEKELSLYDYFIIKPSLFGGINQVRDLCDLLDENKKKIIFSNCYEGKAAIDCYRSLALEFSPNEIHGLGTLDMFNLEEVEYEPL